MKLRSLLLSSLLFLQTSIYSQVNFVPNPSFEDTIILNVFFGQGCITNWKNLDSNSLTKCRFGYFSRFVLPSNSFTLPSNGWFYQNARHGDGVIALVDYWTAWGLPQPSTIRSTTRVKLKSQLLAGKQYCAKMYVSPFEVDTYFTNGAGMYFDNGQLDTIVAQDSSGIYPFVNPQVQCGFIIDDTLNWRPVQGTFTATGSETYLTIANFLSDANTQKSFCKATELCLCSEIIIDDVSLIATDISNWLHDTTIVLGDSVYIGLPKYEVPDGMWYDINMNYIAKGSGIKVKPTQSMTKYIQAIDVCSSIRFDTMTVYAYPLGVSNISGNIGIEIYPNPISTLVEIKVSGSIESDTQIELFNTMGKLVKRVKLSSFNKVVIDVTDLANGIYYLKCDSRVRKILKE